MTIQKKVIIVNKKLYAKKSMYIIKLFLFKNRKYINLLLSALTIP